MPTKKQTPEVKQKIELSFEKYYVHGLTCITHWFCNKGFIPMDGFYVDDIDDDTLIENLNDAGYGAKSIDGAILNISALYTDEHGVAALKFLKEKRVGTIHEGAEEYFERL